MFSGGLERKSIAKIVSGTLRMISTPTHVCAKTTFVANLQQKVGELVLSINFCASIIILQNTLNW
jgi:hypothetical protein